MRPRLRWFEALLLAMACGLTALAIYLVNAAAEQSGVASLSYPILLMPLALLVLTHAGLTLFRPTANQFLLPLGVVLCGLGLAVILRVSPSAFNRQVAWLSAGLLAMNLCLYLPNAVTLLRRYRYTWAALGLALVAFTLVFGVDPNGSGARLWLNVGGQYFQPSELLKLLLVVFLAAYLDERRELLASGDLRLGHWRVPSLAHTGPLLLMWGLSVLLLVIQRDLGATLLFFGLFLALLYTATSRLAFVLAGVGLVCGAAYAASVLVPHVQSRIGAWIDPWSDPLGTGYQAVQGLLALSSGGLFGTGWGYGHPGNVPAGQTDFPLAVLGEQTGLAGTLAVAGIYLLLTLCGLGVAARARDGFAKLLAVGLTCTVALQAIIIMAGNVRLLPLTGITLPFVSYGGSSLLASFLALGLLLRLSIESSTQRGDHSGRADAGILQREPSPSCAQGTNK